MDLFAVSEPNTGPPKKKTVNRQTMKRNAGFFIKYSMGQPTIVVKGKNDPRSLSGVYNPFRLTDVRASYYSINHTRMKHNTDNDTFGRDPQVRYMRRIFASIEAAQKRFLESAQISVNDERLRQAREKALRFFERSWIEVIERTNASADTIAADIYLICLERAMAISGFEIPEGLSPCDLRLKKLVDEVLK